MGVVVLSRRASSSSRLFMPIGLLAALLLLCTLSALSLASGRPLADGIDDQVVDPLDMELNGRHLLADRRHVVDQKSADKEVRARL